MEAASLQSDPARAANDQRSRLSHLIAEHKLEGLLISTEKDIYYLTGFVGHDSLLLVFADGTAAIVTDPRYDEFLNPWRGMEQLEIVMGVRHRLEESIAQLAKSRTVQQLGVQAESMTLTRRAALAKHIGGDAIIETSGLVASLRMKKDAGEIALIERAVEIQQQAINAALAKLRAGMTELQFCAELEYEMKMRGSFAPSFETMIASGAGSSVIHYQTSGKTIGEGPLMVDWGAVVDGYHSDMTRTFSIGPMSPKMREIYGIVLDAQLAAIDAIKPGKTCAEIDEVARRIIRDAGYGEHFGHGLGHGLGMDVHEPPYFNELQTDVVLEPGMVMTVEPGIYLPEIGGVRIEDDVLVTDSGCRVLCSYPKDLGSAVIEFVERSRTGEIPARSSS